MKAWHAGTIIGIVVVYLIAVKFPAWGQKFWTAVGV